MAGSIEGPRRVLDPMRVTLSLPRVPWSHYCCIECKNIANIVNFHCGAYLPPPPSAWLRILRLLPGERSYSLIVTSWSFLESHPKSDKSGNFRWHFKNIKNNYNKCMISHQGLQQTHPSLVTMYSVVISWALQGLRIKKRSGLNQILGFSFRNCR